jgi:hypothetical protein
MIGGIVVVIVAAALIEPLVASIIRLMMTRWRTL